jgi:diguanylate cyclase (GGDEF)-like protein
VNDHRLRRPRRSQGLLILLVAGLLCAPRVAAAKDIPAIPTEHAGKGLRTLTTAGEAHGLTTEQAGLSYPVHLRGLVTCVDPSTPPQHSAFFLHDSTGSVYVLFADEFKGKFPAGSLVDVVGLTYPGSGAPMIVQTTIRVIGHAPLPDNPPTEDLFHLETGAEDGKWVEVEGTIHSVVELDRYVTMQLSMMGGTVGVLTSRDPGVNYASLIDAKVHIRGNAAPLFNRNDQIIGARLMTPGLASIRVLEAAPDDPFALPTTLIDNLLRWYGISTAHHRVHLRGRVTLQWPGSTLCIQDATRAICAQTVQDTPLAEGDLADVVGFAESENGNTVLMDAIFRGAGHGGAVAGKPVTAQQALLGKGDSELIQIDGQLLDSDLASAGNTLVMSSGDMIFTAIVPRSLVGKEAAAWKVGSRLRVTGICSVQLDVQSRAVGRGIAVAKSFQVLIRSPRDIVVLQRPTWWTTGHTAAVLGFGLMAMLGAIGWITRLRRRVHVQTAALEKAREEAAAIDELARAMQEVTAQRKLTARVSANGSEQIAQLGIGFNRMLAELEKGDLATRTAEAKLQQQALTDELTGLPNRRSLSERLTQCVALAQREQRTLAVLFVDLDGFKAVNDNLGHAAGDLLLIEVARRLKSRIRQSDTLARLGGDEFTILLTVRHTTQEAETVAEDLIEVLGQPLVIEGREVNVGASIGVSLYPRDGSDPETLLQQADSAMYMAKGKGKNQVYFFTSELGSSVRERLSLESQLRGAIWRDEIHLHYQPIFDLASYRLTRFEALARWTHPVLGSVSPGKFIPVAEESGLIIPLGAYVMRQACIEAVKWQALAPRPIQVAVNVSSLQFTRPTFVDEVAQTLEVTGLKPKLLQIELTESIMVIGVDRAVETMNRLRALGVTLAIDDFGTGYSCLSYLPRLPFDMLKIDRSFVHEMASSSGSKSIVSLLIALAHSLNMQVVVEGVETVEQLDIIKSMHGTEVQGFLVGRPTANPQSILAPEPDPATFSVQWMTETVS